MGAAADRSNMFAAYAPRDPSTVTISTRPQDLEIVPATADDADDVARLLAWREGFSLADAARRTNETLNIPRENLFLVARIAGQLAGFARAEFVQHKPTPYEHVPQGWYLVGVIIDAAHRRRGIGLELTRARLAWIGKRAREAYYFANSTNRATIDLHARLGFREIMRDFTFPRATFTGGLGVLFRVEL
jgi:ribosomal protein S18 acetylase RimI-like enzyme